MERNKSGGQLRTTKAGDQDFDCPNCPSMLSCSHRQPRLLSEPVSQLIDIHRNRSIVRQEEIRGRHKGYLYIHDDFTSDAMAEFSRDHISRKLAARLQIPERNEEWFLSPRDLIRDVGLRADDAPRREQEEKGERISNRKKISPKGSVSTWTGRCDCSYKRRNPVTRSFSAPLQHVHEQRRKRL